MTIAELIEKLKTYDPKLPVLVDGYEGGYDDPHVGIVDVMRRSYRMDYWGDYDIYFYHEHSDKEPPIKIISLVISRHKMED